MDIVLAVVLGALMWWSITVIARSIAFGGRSVGSSARQRWLSKMDYEALLRTRKQIDDEIARRQP